MTSRPDDDAAASVDGAPASGTPEPETAESGAAAHESEAPAAESVVEGASAAPASDPDREPALAPVTVDRDVVEVRARLVPRYGRFMVLGAIVGAVGGWLWSRLGSSGPWLNAGPVIDTSAIVPFLVAVGALAGVVLGAVLAIVLDRLVGRRRRTVTAERTRHHRGDVDDD